MPHTLNYNTDSTRPLAVRLRRLGLAAGVSVALGYGWVIGIALLGAGDPTAAVSSMSGVVAGLAAGMFTVWSRSRRPGRDWWPYVLLNLYVGILVYWGTFFVLEDLPDVLRRGVDGGVMHNITAAVLNSLIFGTVPLGIVLLPACFASRWLVWRTYRGPAAA